MSLREGLLIGQAAEDLFRHRLAALLLGLAHGEREGIVARGLLGDRELILGGLEVRLGDVALELEEDDGGDEGEDREAAGDEAIELEASHYRPHLAPPPSIVST